MINSFMPQSYPWVRFKAIPVGNLLPERNIQQWAMEEIYEARRAALESMIKDMGRGAISNVADKIGVDPSYLSRCLYPFGKKGRKNIGDELVTKLDEKFPLWSKKQLVATPIGKPKSRRENRISELKDIASKIDDQGIDELIGMAKLLSVQRPFVAKQTAQSSA